MTPSRAIYRDAGKPDQAVPVTTSAVNLPHSLPGPVPYRDGPVPSPTIDGVLYVAAEVLCGEAWAARHNAEIWGAWCNDATGYSFED